MSVRRGPSPRKKPGICLIFPAAGGVLWGSDHLFWKMFSRALADRCTLATKGSVGDRPFGGRSRPRFGHFSVLGAYHMADLDMLTSRQREIYSFIRSKIQGRGY